MTSRSFEKMPASSWPWQMDIQDITAPTARERPMPQYSDLTALSYFPAPAFWATKADMACEKAEGTSMMKAHTFSATPTPAEGTTPRALTMACMTRKDMLTSRSDSAMGSPRRRTCATRGLSKRMCCLSSRKGSCFFRTSISEMATLTAWAATVAMAAPAAPMWQTATNSRSPTMLTAQAMATVTSGVTESPMPRNTLPIRL